tara:strand:+ start:135 stop:779 length:645 start_codon:yes stop_codon:yes gene_type:complete
MREFILSYIMQCIVNFSFITSRVVVHGNEYLEEANKSKSPVLFCVWHYRLIYAVYFFKNPKYNLYALISGHRDAEILAKIMYRWKINLIRGSSTRGWKHAIVEMQKRLRDSSTVLAVTNDGPKGPPKIAKAGTVKMALKNNAKIITMTAVASKYFEFNTWDKFRLPKPFSTINIHLSKPLEIDQSKLEKMDDGQYLTEFMNEFEQTIDGQYSNA